MTKKMIVRNRKPEGGFTLIELLVVVLIIGILAAIAVPQYFKVVEKGKISEALSTFDSLRGAQERYLAAAGNYCVGTPSAAIPACVGWDVPPMGLKYFTINAMALKPVGNTPGWTMTLTRAAPLPATYGGYTLTYTIAQGAQPTIACDQADCTSDLLPQ